MSILSLFNTTMTTRRSDPSVNGIGEEVDGFSNNLTGVACRLQQLGARELTEKSQAVVGTHKVWFGPGLDVKAQDEIVIGGVTYEVTGVNLDVAGAGHHGEAYLLVVS